jgi:hypothetical protein
VEVLFVQTPDMDCLLYPSSDFLHQSSHLLSLFLSPFRILRFSCIVHQYTHLSTLGLTRDTESKGDGARMDAADTNVR